MGESITGSAILADTGSMRHEQDLSVKLCFDSKLSKFNLTYLTVGFENTAITSILNQIYLLSNQSITEQISRTHNM